MASLDCIFCKIAAGEMKADLIFEDPHVVAFRDINPQAPVHILIVPKKHIERVSSLADEELPLVGAVHKAAIALAAKENVIKDGFRIVVNEGRNGGQTVSHLHYHMLGGRPMKWPPG